MRTGSRCFGPAGSDRLSLHSGHGHARQLAAWRTAEAGRWGSSARHAAKAPRERRARWSNPCVRLSIRSARSSATSRYCGSSCRCRPAVEAPLRRPRSRPPCRQWYPKPAPARRGRGRGRGRGVAARGGARPPSPARKAAIEPGRRRGPASASQLPSGPGRARRATGERHGAPSGRGFESRGRS